MKKLTVRVLLLVAVVKLATFGAGVLIEASEESPLDREYRLCVEEQLTLGLSPEVSATNCKEKHRE